MLKKDHKTALIYFAFALLVFLIFIGLYFWIVNDLSRTCSIISGEKCRSNLIKKTCICPSETYKLTQEVVDNYNDLRYPRKYDNLIKINLSQYNLSVT